MKKIMCGLLITMLLSSAFTSSVLMQPTFANPGFWGWFQKQVLDKATRILLVATPMIVFTAGTMITTFLSAWVAYATSPLGLIIRIIKSVAAGMGWISGLIKVTKANGVLVWIAWTIFSEAEYEVPITSMSEEGWWTIELEGMPSESQSVGGVITPVNKFGLLAPYIGLASTIAVATVAAAIYAKRVKCRKEKQ